MVLPDKYKPDSDVVMWMEDAAPDKDEATQRAAVVALARVATNLPLQRLLSRCAPRLPARACTPRCALARINPCSPTLSRSAMHNSEYKDRFVAEEGRERERQERVAAQAAAAARRRAFAERPQPKLQTVYMSEDKRRMVEAALAALRLSEGASAAELAADADEDGGGWEDECGEEGGDAPAAPPASAALRQRLLGLSFGADDVEDALAQPQCRTLPASLDWCVCRALVQTAAACHSPTRTPSCRVLSPGWC